MSGVRGRPPGLAGGIRGASGAYCSSLRACPAPKSPTNARLSAVHMACLHEGLLPSLNRWHDHSASSSAWTARASQTASKKFENDPIVGRRYSAITSIVSSAYKRHGKIIVYRPRLVGHRVRAYAARAAAGSCSCLIAAGGLNPCRSISQVAL